MKFVPPPHPYESREPCITKDKYRATVGLTHVDELRSFLAFQLFGVKREGGVEMLSFVKRKAEGYRRTKMPTVGETEWLWTFSEALNALGNSPAERNLATVYEALGPTHALRVNAVIDGYYMPVDPPLIARIAYACWRPVYTAYLRVRYPFTDRRVLNWRVDQLLVQRALPQKI
jgi:hypothetical protein